MLAADADVDLAHAVPLSLLDVVDEVQLAGFFQKPRIGPDVGEDKTTAAVDIADHAEIRIHLRLVERLAAGELELPRNELALELAVSDERHVADVVTRPLVDDEREHRPLTLAAVHHLQLAAHLGLEKAEAAVVGGERLDVGVDLGAVEVAADEPHDAGLRLDLREQAGVGRDGVADEARPQRLAAPPFVDQKDRTLVARLAALDRGHLRGFVALLLVIRLDTSPGLLDHVGIHRVADFDFRLLADGAGRDALVADVFDVPEHRPLHHLEDHDHALLDADVLRVDVDELAAAMERANILLDRLGVEDLAGTGDELGQLRNVGGMVAFDPHLDDPVGLVDRAGRRQGYDAAGRLGRLAMGRRHPEPRQRQPCRQLRQPPPETDGDGPAGRRCQQIWPSTGKYGVAKHAREHQWCR